MPESRYRSGPAVEPSFDLSRVGRGHSNGTDALLWVANVFVTPEDHILPVANGSSVYSDRLPFGDPLPDMGPDRDDGLCTVDGSCYTVWVREYPGVEVTTRTSW